MEKNNNKILIVAPQFKSIPSNFGGVEGLITDLINENEKQGKAQFFIVSKKPAVEETQQFKNSHFMCFNSENQTDSRAKQYYFSYQILKLVRKIFRNRLTSKFFRSSNYIMFEDNYFGYYCYRITKRVDPQSVIIFGYDKIHHFWQLVKLWGNKNVYYHLHYCREEDLKLRNLIPNTIATSEYVYNKWNKTHIKNEKSAIIHHGIDFKKFKYNFNHEIIKKKREELGFSDEDFVVIFTGRLRPGKGVLELLTAYDYIKDKNIKLLMLGEFDRKSQDEEQFEAKVIEKVKNNKNIVRLGFIPNDQLPLYYSCANAQVAPTVYEEAAGLVTIEGMLAGLPIIITKSGGMPEYVDDKCSIKLDIDNNLSKNIATSIIRLAKDPNLCKKMGNISKKCASQFTISEYYNNLLSFLLKQ